MKIITWNINGIRAVHRHEALLPFIAKNKPELLFLQEIKGKAEQFPAELLKHPQYTIHYHSAVKPGYAGTGLWLRKTGNFKLDSVLTSMPMLDKADGDTEGRIIGVRGTYKGKSTVFLGVYFPNGGKSDAAFEEKLVFYQNFLSYVNNLQQHGHQVFWGGDVNCAHHPVDLARPKENDGKVGFHPRERAWMDKLNAAEWADIYRQRYPETKAVYSWWSLRSGARANNVGWRIDYFFTHKTQLPLVNKISYHPAVTGSDHCPLMLELN